MTSPIRQFAAKKRSTIVEWAVVSGKAAVRGLDNLFQNWHDSLKS